jgi:hypothetical protein
MGQPERASESSNERGAELPDATEWKIRGLVTEEVQKQIAPLAATVTVMDKTLRSLYSNGSGGPPGFLETARAEDKRSLHALNEKISELKQIKEGELDRLDKVEDALKADKDSRAAAAQLLAEQAKTHDKAFKRRLGWATFVLAILQILNILWDHRAEIKRSLGVAPPNPVVQSFQQPEHATIPPLRSTP